VPRKTFSCFLSPLGALPRNNIFKGRRGSTKRPLGHEAKATITSSAVALVEAEEKEKEKKE